jgi:uncharacterized protein YkwD
MLLRRRLLSVALALQAAGCGPLLWHDGTAEVARAHSADMVARDFFAHQNPDGESPFDRLREAGIEWSGGAGENIAWGYPTAAAVLAGWLGSPGHRAKLENTAAVTTSAD